MEYAILSYVRNENINNTARPVASLFKVVCLRAVGQMKEGRNVAKYTYRR